MYDITEWLVSGNITFQMVTQNLLGKVFVITGAVNSAIAEMFDKSQPISDTKTYFNKYNTIGKAFGQVIAAVLAYDALPEDF